MNWKKIGAGYVLMIVGFLIIDVGMGAAYLGAVPRTMVGWSQEIVAWAIIAAVLMGFYLGFRGIVAGGKHLKQKLANRGE